LEMEKLTNAFNRLVDRHESLRTSFEVVDGEVVQRIAEKVDLSIEYFETAEFQPVLEKFVRPFDLRVSPLIRVGVIQVASSMYILMIDLHHIITDAISQRILMKDFMMLYENKVLPELTLQYKDYAEWQYALEQQEKISAQKTFWSDFFSQLPTPHALPVDFMRPAVKRYEGGSIDFELTGDETRALKSLADREKTTVYAVLLSIYCILLSKLSHQDDIVIGTPTAGRQHTDLEGMIGMFVNTLPLRNHPAAGLAFNAFLKQVNATMLACFGHQAFQYDELVETLKLQRDLGRNPLFDVMFAYQDFEDTTFEIPGLTIKPLDKVRAISKFDLTLTAIDTRDNIRLYFEYAISLFRKETVERFIGHFKNIVSSIIKNPGTIIADIEIVNEVEKHELLVGFNNTRVSYPTDKTIIDLFEDAATLQPSKIAAVYNSKGIRYRELAIKVNGLVRLMRAKGIRSGDRIAIMVDHSFELLVSLMATMKCGGTFVPIDVHWPLRRKNEILESVDAALVLYKDEAIMEGVHSGAKLLVEFEAIPEVVAIDKAPVSQDDPIYIIYTSGTTGRPKGVVVPYKGIMNRLFWMNDFFGPDTAASVLHTTRYVYDSMVWQLFWPLMNGGQTIILPSDAALTSEKICTLISDYEIRLADFVPSVFNTIFEYAENPDYDIRVKLKSLRYVIQGGEEITEKTTRKFLAQYPQVNMVNLYGPTEASIGCIFHVIPRDGVGKIPIGKPISNVAILILDRDGNSVPVGVSGELCISGECLAIGYFNDPVQTGLKFVIDKKTGIRIYKTGDLAKWRPDGTIDFLGRMDEQVKINGFRVELDEIKAVLSTYPGIRDVVILVNETGDHKYLIAYYIADEEIASAILWDFLSERIPAPVVPASYVHIHKIPFTPAGKLDREALPTHPGGYSEVERAPSTTTEKILVEIWSNLLRMDKAQIGINRNFFELGGHSLLSVRLVNTIQQKFSVDVKVREVFGNPTIKKLSRIISSRAPVKNVAIIPVEKRDYYPASAAQARLFYEQMLDKDGIGYNIYGIYEIRGPVSLTKLEESFQLLINRHESLRTSFALTGNGVVQRISDQSLFKLIRIPATANETIEDSFFNFIKAFDLSSPPLMRCGLWRNEGRGNFLFIDIHHIICDGLSLNILMNDFKNLYRGNKLPAIELRYVDYSIWLHNAHAVFEKQKAYWLRKLCGEFPKMNLPVRQPRETVDVHLAATQMLEIKGEHYQSIRKFAASENVSEFMFLLSLYYILFARISGNTDIVIGTDVVGRTQVKVKDIVGTFVNLLPLRFQVHPQRSYTQFLQEVKECVLDAFEHQDFQFDQMIPLLNLSERGNPIEVHFSFANVLNSTVELNEVEILPVDLSPRATTHFEFTLKAITETDRLKLLFTYSRELYDEETIRVFIAYYHNILLTVLENPSVCMEDIAIENSVSPVTPVFQE